MRKFLAKTLKLAMNTLVFRETLKNQVGNFLLVPFVPPHLVHSVRIIGELSRDSLNVDLLG